MAGGVAHRYGEDVGEVYGNVFQATQNIVYATDSLGAKAL